MAQKEAILVGGLFNFPVYPVDGSADLNMTGGNKKGVLLILGEAPTPERKDFLGKILHAVGLDYLEDALAIELAPGQAFSFANLAEKEGIRQALFFGAGPKQAMLNLNVQKYHPFKVGGISFLFSDELSAIQSQPSLKRPLWEALKIVFGGA